VRRDIAGFVRSATVAIVASPPRGPTIEGSGFFVAPGVAITCAHVVLAAPGPVEVLWEGQTYAVRTVVLSPANMDRTDSIAAPDTAVLTLDAPPDHPCAPLTDGDDPEPAADLLALGYTAVRIGAMEPDRALLRSPGRIGWPGGEFLRLAGGQIGHGLSGGPVLDLARRGVCAMTKATLGEPTDLGGYAVPIDDALAVGDATLRTDNENCLGLGLPALRRDQVGLGKLPLLVADKIKSVTSALVLHLDDLGVTRPVDLADADLAEWVARQLFERDVYELVRLLRGVEEDLGRAAVGVAEVVICFLPPHDDAAAAWVSADTAEALRLEWARDRPRVTRMGSRCEPTVNLVLRRALRRRVPDVAAPLPVNADVGPEGLSVQARSDLVMSLAHALGMNPQIAARNVPKLLTHAHKADFVACLHEDLLRDADLLTALLRAFGGLRFLVYSRDVPAPPDAADVVLDLRPPVDEDDENAVLALLSSLRAQHWAVS
jgi:hypothetical protein